MPAHAQSNPQNRGHTAATQRFADAISKKYAAGLAVQEARIKELQEGLAASAHDYQMLELALKDAKERARHSQARIDELQEALDDATGKGPFP